MAGYKNFNFVLFLPFKGDFAEFAFHDAFALNNFRVIIPTFVDMGSSVGLSFAPYRPSNNPQAFKNLSAFNPRSPQFFYNDFPTKAPIVFIFFPHKFNHFEAAGFFRQPQSGRNAGSSAGRPEAGGPELRRVSGPLLHRAAGGNRRGRRRSGENGAVRQRRDGADLCFRIRVAEGQTRPDRVARL